MDIKGRILELMAERKWTNYKLAKECGIYITTVNSWFNENNYNPNLESIENICNAFGITVAEFFSGVSEGNLTTEQLVLLEKYSKVPENRRKIVTDLIDVLIDEQEKPKRKSN